MSLWSTRVHLHVQYIEIDCTVIAVVHNQDTMNQIHSSTLKNTLVDFTTNDQRHHRPRLPEPQVNDIIVGQTGIGEQP